MKWKRWRENNKPEALSIQQKLSNILKQPQMVQKFPEKSFQKLRKLLRSEMRSFQSKILEILGAKLNGKKTSGKKNFSKIWVYLVRLPPFLEIPENAVPLATGSCQKFKPEVLVECKVPKILLKKE